jgi:Eisosome component PIL1
VKQTRQKLKEAYAAEFAATIERAEKQIILARHGRRLLNLLDDTPVVPGDIRPAYEHTNQARQILNDAEDDLKDWQPELEDVPSSSELNDSLMPSSTSRRQQTVEGSVMGGESVVHHDHQVAGEHLEQNADGSQISSSTSVTTGTAAQTNYPRSESAVSVVA